MPNPTPERLEELARDEHKRCFTYCGDDLCNCPARDLHMTLDFITPALGVLSTMCDAAGLNLGKAKADEMHTAGLRASQAGAKPETETGHA